MGQGGGGALCGWEAVVRGRWVDRILSGELWDSRCAGVCSQEGDYHFPGQTCAGRGKGIDDQPEQTGEVDRERP